MLKVACEYLDKYLKVRAVHRSFIAVRQDHSRRAVASGGRRNDMGPDLLR